MISFDNFENIVINELERDIKVSNNRAQNIAIKTPSNKSLFIVAGPGSGKTTVMVLKILKFIFVDDVDPSNILATTFTRKAASELRSRILNWGNKLKQSLEDNPRHVSIKSQVEMLNFNHVITGTLDSIAEDALKNCASFTVIEDFVSNSLMIQSGLFNHERWKDKDLKSFLNLVGGTKTRLNISMMSKTLLEIKDRIYHDDVDFKKFIDNQDHLGAKKVNDIIYDYIVALKEKDLLDFTMLESKFLKNLQNGALDDLFKDIQIILVDEYQDTNLLQEQIYFKLADMTIQNGGSIIVVGDDDQSLYRFRGAQVDLFNNFRDRIKKELNITPESINLSNNYRSTENIVNFCNNFISLDIQFQDARVKNKKAIVSSRSESHVNYPILGMFRDDVETLADDLAEFIHKILYSDNILFNSDHPSAKEVAELNPQDIAFEKEMYEQNLAKYYTSSDIALLCSSPLEMDFKGNPRLSFLLRDRLNRFNPPVNVFNPRGQDLGRVPDIEILCGLILECIDHGRMIQDNLKRLPQNAVSRLKSWRLKALKYAKKDNQLEEFLRIWPDILVQNSDGKLKVSLTDLISNIVKWIPSMRDDDESLIHLEAITRTVAQTSLFSEFGAEILFFDDESELKENSATNDLQAHNLNLNKDSIIDTIWNVFVPIAIGAINLDLDVLETIPHNRMNIMSIHQSKGLEFSITIVDVGSDFKMNYASHAFRRFPGKAGKTCNIENNLRKYSSLGIPDRDSIDREFDDLIRQYFVAFSRSKDILLIVGLNSVRNGYYLNHDIRYVPNIATGWDRDMKWHWDGLNNIKHL